MGSFRHSSDISGCILILCFMIALLMAPSVSITATPLQLRRCEHLWTRIWEGVNLTTPIGMMMAPEESLYMVVTSRATPDDPLEVHRLHYGQNGTFFQDTYLPVVWSPVTAIASDPDGLLYLVGAAWNASLGTSDAAIARIEANGSLAWVEYWGGDGSDRFEAVAVSPNGELVAVGSTDSFGSSSRNGLIVKYSKSGEQLWNYSWTESTPGFKTEFETVALGLNKEIYVAGTRRLTYAVGSYGMLVAKFNQSNQLEWNLTWSDLHAPWVFIQSAITAAGDFLHLGRSSGSGGEEFLWLTVDQEGQTVDEQLLMRQFYLPGNYAWLSSMVKISMDTFLAVGDLSEWNREKGMAIPSVFLLAFDEHGSQLWNATWFRSPGAIGDVIASGGANGFYIGGRLFDPDSWFLNCFIARFRITADSRRSGLNNLQIATLLGMVGVPLLFATYYFTKKMLAKRNGTGKEPFALIY